MEAESTPTEFRVYDLAARYVERALVHVPSLAQDYLVQYYRLNRLGIMSRMSGAEERFPLPIVEPSNPAEARYLFNELLERELKRADLERPGERHLHDLVRSLLRGKDIAGLRLPNDLQPFEKRVITPTQFQEDRVVWLADRRLIEYLAQHPEEVRDLTPREFEELVAELLSRFDYEVRLSPMGRDGGVDVFAERKGSFGLELMLVQCKRYSPHHKVGDPIVKQLFAEVVHRRATKGLVVTTSTFTHCALDFIAMNQYQLAGADHGDLESWLSMAYLGGRTS